MFENTSRAVINTSTTNPLGYYRITKKFTSSTSRPFSLMAGVDAGGTGYFGRVGAPSFITVYGVAKTCADVNCNYRQSQIAGGPYRENYHLGWNWDLAKFKGFVVHGTNNAMGFDFRPANCSN